jgi:peptide/nickel transport system permease protein
MKMNFRIWKMPQSVKWSIGFMLLLMLLSIMTPLLKGDNPIIQKSGNETFYFPDQASHTNSSDSFWQLRPMIPISEKNIDLKRRLLPPLSVSGHGINTIRHWAGTDHLGRDVAAGLLEGIWYALAIGFGVMIISFIIGIILGASSGWFGDKEIKWSPIGALIRFMLLSILLILILHWINLFALNAFNTDIFIVMLSLCLIAIVLIFYFISILENKRLMKSKWLKIPLDSVISRIIEWLTAIPALLIILALTAIVKQHSIWTMISLISILTWPLTARLVRAEVMRRKYQPYLQQVRHQEVPFVKVLIRDLLPNIWTPLITVFAFGFSGVIMLDATLSFLSLGLPVEQVNWGNQIGGIRRHPEAWWLVLFPGLMIAGILISLNIIGNWLQDKAGAKGRQLKWF